ILLHLFIVGGAQAARFLVSHSLRRVLAFGQVSLRMPSCYDERDSAQHGERGENVTRSDWFAEHKYSASGSQYGNAELNSGGAGGFQSRGGGGPNSISK